MDTNYRSGLEFYFGINGKSRNHTLAIEFFKKAAISDTNEESVYSMVMLSKCYLQGLGIREDEEKGLVWLVKAANTSCGSATASAKNDLGMLILNNIKSQNPDEVKLYCQSLQSNDSEAKPGSTVINFNRIDGKEKDRMMEETNIDDGDEDDDHYGVGDAIKLLMEAADEGHVEARTNLGRIYEEAGDLEQTNDCYLQAIQNGCCKAALFLGHLYLRCNSFDENGIGYNNNAYSGGKTDKNVESLIKYQQRAYVLLKTAALNGETEAFNLLGQCYQFGKGVKQDIDQAIYYYRKGSKTGDKVSAYNLGMLLIDKASVIPNNTPHSKTNNIESLETLPPAEEAKISFDEGIRFLRTSSDLECKDAAYELGKIYELGLGVDADIHAALSYYKWAAKLGHNESALFAANILYAQANNFGNILLIFEASELYYQAAVNGMIPSAMNSYGILLEDGLTNKDGIKYTQNAASWYYEAGIHGEQKSFFNLAALLATDKSFVAFSSVFSEGTFITVSEAKVMLNNYFSGEKFQGNKDERAKALEFVDIISDNIDVESKALLEMKDYQHSHVITMSNNQSPASKNSGNKYSNHSFSQGSINSKSVRYRSQSTANSIESGTIDSKKVPTTKKITKKQLNTVKPVLAMSDDKEEQGVQYTTDGFVYPPNYAPRLKAHAAPVSITKPPARTPVEESIPPTLISLNKRVTAPAIVDSHVTDSALGAKNLPLPPVHISTKNAAITTTTTTTPQTDVIVNPPVAEPKSQEVDSHPHPKPRKKPMFILDLLRPFTARKHEIKYVGPYTEPSVPEPKDKIESTSKVNSSSRLFSKVLVNKFKKKKSNKDLASAENVQDQSVSTCNDVGDPTSDLSLSSKDFP